MAKGGICFLLTFSLLLVLVHSSLDDLAAANDDNFSPNPARDWICYTTSRSINETGGVVNFNKCNGGNATADHQAYLGYIGALIAVVFFGSNFIPVKSFDTGDGVFFQWILCVGIWLVSLVVNLIRSMPPFFMPALFGGFLWTTGNLAVVAIIKMIGMTMGLTLWGVTNMLSGWVTGNFILHGWKSLSCPGLNVGGLGVVIISTIVLAFVKSEGKTKKPLDKMLTEKTPLINSQKEGNGSLAGSLTDKLLQGRLFTERSQPVTGASPTFSDEGETNVVDEDESWVDKMGVWPKRIFGFALALFVGFFFGTQFIAVEFMRRCDDDAHSCDELDYVFGHFTGIFIASTMWFIIYCIIKRNRPKIYPKVILPALISGIMWGIAMTAWFVANQHLLLSVSFPIITAGPGLVSSLWGILVFREIKGKINILLFFIACVISIFGQVMVGLSNGVVTCG